MNQRTDTADRERNRDGAGGENGHPGQPQDGCPRSLLETGNVEPWEFYESILESGEVTWDPAMEAWIVPGWDACRYVLRNDNRLFRHPAEALPPDEPYRVIEGPASIMLLGGEAHTRLHNFWVRQFAPPNVDEWRNTIIRPMVNSIIDQFADRGRAELVDELVEPVPIRVIAAVFGLPWENDELIDRYKQLLHIKLAYFDRVRAVHGGATPAQEEERARITAETFEAWGEMKALLAETIEERRDNPQDDLISRLWEEGPNLIDGWGMEHMQSAIANMFFGGTDTTTHAICNALYVLLMDPSVADGIRDRGEPGLVAFSEEMLRLFGSVHFRPRVSNMDQEIDGVAIGKDDTVITVNLAANRDPSHFRCPSAVDLDRDAPRTHLSFNSGPRSCAGAALARAEIQEIVRGALDRLPDLRRDEEAEPPSFTGFLLRSYRPLHAEFTPAG